MDLSKVPDRKKWQAFRDSHGVKKGASKVSIGDALESFHKSKNTADAIKSGEKLLKSIDQYKKDVAKTNKDFPGKMQGFLQAPVEKITNEAQDYPKRISALKTAMGALDNYSRELTAKGLDLPKLQVGLAACKLLPQAVDNLGQFEQGTPSFTAFSNASTKLNTVAIEMEKSLKKLVGEAQKPADQRDAKVMDDFKKLVAEMRDSLMKVRGAGGYLLAN